MAPKNHDNKIFQRFEKAQTRFQNKRKDSDIIFFLLDMFIMLVTTVFPQHATRLGMQIARRLVDLQLIFYIISKNIYFRTFFRKYLTIIYRYITLWHILTEYHNWIYYLVKMILPIDTSHVPCFDYQKCMSRNK